MRNLTNSVASILWDI